MIKVSQTIAAARAATAGRSRAEPSALCNGAPFWKAEAVLIDSVEPELAGTVLVETVEPELAETVLVETVEPELAEDETVLVLALGAALVGVEEAGVLKEHGSVTVTVAPFETVV